VSVSPFFYPLSSLSPFPLLIKWLV
jgi:hypothetical protein